MLFKLPRKVGDFNGNEITANNGRFGPYIKYVDSFVSIPKAISPFEINLDMAIDLIKEKQKANEPIHKYKSFPVTKGKGRFGPFIKWNNLFINVNNKFDFENLSHGDIEFLIDEKLKRGEEKVIKVWEADEIKIEKARWGRFKIIHEKGFVELPKDSEPSKLSLTDVMKIISENKSSRSKEKNKVMSLDYLEPVPIEVLETIEGLPDHVLGEKHRNLYKDSGLPDILKIKICLIFINEIRNSHYQISQFNSNEFRKQFYKLYPGNWNFEIADFGDLPSGKNVEDTYYALSEICKELKQAAPYPVIIGGSQDLTIPSV